MRPFGTLSLLAALFLGCGDTSSTPDAAVGADVSATDTGSVLDTGPALDTGTDAGVRVDAGTVADVPTVADTGVDAGTAVDAGRFDIVGEVSGACGTLRAMLASPMPSMVDNRIVFTPDEPYVRGALSPGGQRVFDAPNAGGSSIESEVMSLEILHHCEGASLLRTETEVRYQPPSDAGGNSITDILLEIGGSRVGVSVTRVWRPMPLPFPEADVRTLLLDKLNGINRSTQRVLPEDRWVKQILHVFVADSTMAATVRRVWDGLDATVRANTIVLVTVTQGGGFLYCNPDPPLGQECPAIRM